MPMYVNVCVCMCVCEPGPSQTPQCGLASHSKSLLEWRGWTRYSMPHLLISTTYLCLGRRPSLRTEVALLCWACSFKCLVKASRGTLCPSMPGLSSASLRPQLVLPVPASVLRHGVSSSPIQGLPLSPQTVWLRQREGSLVVLTFSSFSNRTGKGSVYSLAWGFSYSFSPTQ